VGYTEKERSTGGKWRVVGGRVWGWNNGSERTDQKDGVEVKKSDWGCFFSPALSFKSLCTSVLVVTHGSESGLTPRHSSVLALHIWKRRSDRSRKNFTYAHFQSYWSCILYLGNVNYNPVIKFSLPNGLACWSRTQKVINWLQVE